MNRDSGPITDKITDLLVDMICAVDAQGNYVFVNAASENLLGYAPEEMLGRNMLEFMHPDDRERTLANVRRVMGGEPHSDFQNRYIRRDGRVVDIMWSARWSAEDGLRLAVGRDVTALRRAARRQEAMYRISEAAQSTRDLPDLLREVHRFVGNLLPAERFLVALTEADGYRVRFPFFFDGEEKVQPSLVLKDEMLLTKVVRSGRGVIANSTGSACEATGSSSGGAVRDWIGAPMISPGGLTGVVAIQRNAVEFGYSEEDLELLQFVATQIASALERKDHEARLRHMAHHDPLTNLPNRILFNDRLEVALCRARREREQLALLYLDLRDFKDVNDELGHAAGDDVLRETARRLKEALRESDTVARIGGDEFTALVSNIRGAGDVERIAAKLHEAVSAPLRLGDATRLLTVDIGAAIYPEHGESADELLRNADADMYHTKRNGPAGPRPEASTGARDHGNS